VTLEQDAAIEKLVMQEFSRMERDGLAITRDCEVTLARRVAERLGAAVFHIATLKERIPFDAGDAATEAIRLANLAINR
jgi:hypothetical protein